jgi:hypothetical protein
MSAIPSPHAKWAIARFRKTKIVCNRRGKLTAVQSVRHGNTKLASNQNFSKSSAQVETLVGPRKVAPPKSCGLKPKRRRASPVKVRLNESENEQVREEARRAEMSVNAFIKCAILGNRYDPKMRIQLLSLNRELTAHGRNLNQIAKHLNGGTLAPSQGVAMLDTIRVPLVRALNAVKKALVQGAPQP